MKDFIANYKLASKPMKVFIWALIVFAIFWTVTFFIPSLIEVFFS